MIVRVFTSAKNLFFLFYIISFQKWSTYDTLYFINFFFFWVSRANCGAYAIAWRNGEEGFELKMLKT